MDYQDTWVEATETDSHEIEEKVEKGAGEGERMWGIEGLKARLRNQALERAGAESL